MEDEEDEEDEEVVRIQVLEEDEVLVEEVEVDEDVRWKVHHHSLWVRGMQFKVLCLFM